VSNDKIYDVVIVGGGVAGSILAKWLTQHGKEVAMIEAGSDDASSYLGYQSYVDRFYKLPNRPNAPYPQNDNAAMPGIPYPEDKTFEPKAWNNPKDKYWIQEGPIPFGSDYTRALGGTTLHWLGISIRNVPNDFHIKKAYEHGRDWPVEYKDMMPYYRRAEYELGVAADVKQQSYLGVEFEEDYAFPMQAFPSSYLDKVLGKAVDGTTFKDGDKEYPIKIVPTPQARNAMPNPKAGINSMTAPEGPVAWKKAHPDTKDPGFRPIGNPTDLGVGLGERCEGNSSCIPICPVQAKYNAMKTLAQADKKFLDLRSQCVASKILLDENRKKVTGVEYKCYKDSSKSDHSTETIKGRIYVLAAHAVENAKLCLISGVANSSDQMGRNLMDHPYINFSGLYHKKIWGYRGPDVTSGMPLMRDGEFRKERASFRTDIGNWGWVFPKGAPASIVEDMVETQGLYGATLRAKLEDQGPRHMRIGYLIEQLANPENRVLLHDKHGKVHLDQLDIPRPVIQYDVDDYTLAGMESATKLTEQIFKVAGIEMQEQVTGSGNKTYKGKKSYKGKKYTFWGSGHLIGTHIMGDDPHNSVVDSYQQTHDHENLFMAGCGSHPTSGTANPTLTMAALTFRTLDKILEKLKN